MISGAMSVEKPDSRMAALGVFGVRARGREATTLTSITSSGQLEDINRRCCFPACELKTHQAEVGSRGNHTKSDRECESCL